MKQKIYISIPIAGHDERATREKADRIKASLSRKGWHPVNPFEVYAGRNPEYADFICCDLRAMMDCDAIYFCEGWEQSCGCNVEHDVAMRFKAHGKKDFKLMYED